MKYLNFKPIDVTDTTVNTTSIAIDLSQIFKISAQIVVGAGTLMTGTIQLQVSNEEISTSYLMSPSPTHWSNLGSSVALSAVSTNTLIPQQDICYRALRVIFTGNGTNDAPVTVHIMALAL